MYPQYLAVVGRLPANLSTLVTDLYIDGNKIGFITGAIIESVLMHRPYNCCFDPKAPHCFSNDKFYLSTCRSLFGLAFRYGTLISGLSVIYYHVLCHMDIENNKEIIESQGSFSQT